MQISENFQLSEFSFVEGGVGKVLDNSPPEHTIEPLRALVEQVLQPARSNFGLPLLIRAGYRSAEINYMLDGEPGSAHEWTANVAAADFEIPSVDNLKLAKWIRDHCRFHELVSCYYHPDDLVPENGGPNSGWVRCTYSLILNAGEVTSLRWVDGESQVFDGLREADVVT